MAIDAGRLKHLELIQQTVTRLAGNSFLVKGWSVTLLSALLAIAVKDGIYQIIWIAFLPCVMFWLLDGYFLRQERLYRRVWDVFRVQGQDQPTDFSMDTTAVASEEKSWLQVCFSKTLFIFHGTLFAVLIVVLVSTCYRQD